MPVRFPNTAHHGFPLANIGVGPVGTAVPRAPRVLRAQGPFGSLMRPRGRLALGLSPLGAYGPLWLTCRWAQGLCVHPLGVATSPNPRFQVFYEPEHVCTLFRHEEVRAPWDPSGCSRLCNFLHIELSVWAAYLKALALGRPTI